MRYQTPIFRYVCLAAVLAAAVLIFFDFFWQHRAWEAEFKSTGRTYSEGLIQTGLMYAALWLMAALIQIITIQKSVFGMDFCRAISLIAACVSIKSSWSEIWEWLSYTAASYGEPLPRTVSWGATDIVLSLPVFLLSLLVFLLFGVSQKRALLPEN